MNPGYFSTHVLSLFFFRSWLSASLCVIGICKFEILCIFTTSSTMVGMWYICLSKRTFLRIFYVGNLLSKYFAILHFAIREVSFNFMMQTCLSFLLWTFFKLLTAIYGPACWLINWGNNAASYQNKQLLFEFFFHNPKLFISTSHYKINTVISNTWQ